MGKCIYVNKFDGSVSILLTAASIGLGILPSLIIGVKEVFFSSILLVTLIGIYDNVHLMVTGYQQERLLQYTTFMLILNIIGVCVSGNLQLSGTVSQIINIALVFSYSVAQLAFRINEYRKLNLEVAPDNNVQTGKVEVETP